MGDNVPGGAKLEAYVDRSTGSVDRSIGAIVNQAGPIVTFRSPAGWRQARQPGGRADLHGAHAIAMLLARRYPPWLP